MLTIPIKSIPIIVSICMKLSCLSACKKTNFITNIFFLKILQGNSKLVPLGDLGMPVHTNLNDSINLKKALMFICRQKINYILQVFLEKCRDIANLLFWVLRIKWNYQLVDNFRVYLQVKNRLHPPSFSGDIAKMSKVLILDTLGMPGNCRKLRCISAYQKMTFINSVLSWDITF